MSQRPGLSATKVETGGASRIALRARGPFDLRHTLESGQAFRWRLLDGWYYGVVAADVWKVRQAGQWIEAESGPTPAAALMDSIAAYFRLADDLTGLYRRLGGDPRITEAIKNYRGLRLLRQDPWECLVSFIISAYSNIKRITHHVEQLAQICGDPVSLDGHDRYTFPTPARMAELGEQDFRRLGLGYRSRFLARLCRDMVDGRIDLVGQRRRSYQEARETLLGIYGVGEKVADCALVFSLDQDRAFPIDIWVRRALLDWYLAGQKMTDRALRAWAAERFGDDAGYAQQYLFHGRRLMA